VSAPWLARTGLVLAVAATLAANVASGAAHARAWYHTVRQPGDAAHDAAARGWDGDDATQLFERVNLGCGWGV
jgi:hypothetical protein